MTLLRDKESTAAQLPPELKPAFTYVTQQIEQLQDAEDRQDETLTDIQAQLADLNDRVFSRGIVLHWRSSAPLPGVTLVALAQAAGERIIVEIDPT